MSSSWDDAPTVQTPRHATRREMRPGGPVTAPVPPQRYLDETRDIRGELYGQQRNRQPEKRPQAPYERRELAFTVLGWVLVALSVEVVVIVTVLGYHLLPGLLRGH